MASSPALTVPRLRPVVFLWLIATLTLGLPDPLFLTARAEEVEGPTSALHAAPAAALSPPSAARSAPLYEVFIDADPTEPMLFRLHLPAAADFGSFFFTGDGGRARAAGGLASIVAVGAEGAARPLRRSGDEFHYDGGTPPAYIEYELHLHPSILKPSTWPNNHPGSLRWDEYAYVAAGSLLRWHGEPPASFAVRLHPPEGWRARVADGRPVEGREPVVFEGGAWTSFGLIAGRELAVLVGDGASLVPVGPLPWPPGQLLESLERLLTSLRRRGLAEGDGTYEFVVARYPGALRLNPLISVRTAGERTFVQWVGVGSADWWHKHTAAELVSSRVAETLPLADDGAWFRAGLTAYGSLALLYETGLLDREDMYHNLKNLVATGQRYAGPLWPSLLLAGVTERTSHEAARVLQFRAPVVAWLFDIELRERSGGELTLLDWWAALAGAEPAAPLHAEDLLPPVDAVGDMSEFARRHIFDVDGLALDFEGMFERWLAAVR